MRLFLKKISGNSSRKCYFCINDCETSQATERKCGESIGPTHEAVCSTRISKGYYHYLINFKIYIILNYR